jgi:hypothetical protein
MEIGNVQQFHGDGGRPLAPSFGSKQTKSRATKPMVPGVGEVRM